MSENPLSEEFVKDLSLVHIEIEQLKKNKLWTYTYFFIIMTIGCILILAGINLWEDFSFSRISYSITKRSSFLLFLGFGLWVFAYRILSKYIRKTKEVKYDLNQINAVLDEHKIEYNCSIEFGEKYHGKQDVTVELKSNSNFLKDSKTTYQI